MIYAMIDYLLVSSLVLLPTVLLWRHIDQPARRVVLGRIALLLLLICIPILAWPHRPAISLQKQQVQPQPIVETVIPGNDFLKSEQFYVKSPREAISIPVTISPPVEVSVVPPIAKQVSSVTVAPRETETAVETPRKRIEFSTTDICNAIVTLYISGAVVLGFWFLCGVMRLFRLVGKSESAPEEILEILHGVTGKPNRVSVVLNRKLASPIVWGTFRPGIALPAFLCDTEISENSRGLRFALVHEWHHIRSGDLWCLALCRMLALFLYPNPLFWMLASRIREEQEILADAAATATKDAEEIAWERRREYALELVRWSRMAASQPSNLATASAALAICEFGKTKQKTSQTLERRVDMLLQNDTVPLKTNWFWKFCCAITLGCMVSFMALFTLQPGKIVVAQNATVKQEEKENAAKPEVKYPYDLPEKITVTVIDEQEKPVAGVEFSLSIWGGELEKSFRVNVKSDENGIAVLDLTPIKGKRFEPCRLWAEGAGYVPLFINWDRISTPYRTIPEEFTLTMEKANEYSGRVLDELGNPIEGVDVKIVGPGDTSGPNKSLGAIWSVWLDDIKTDAEGRWKSNTVPPQGEIRFGFKHPDFLNVQYGQYKVQDGMSREKLLDGTAVYVMSQGIPVTGTVTDPDGKPIPGITVRIGSNDMINYRDNKAATTDEQGKYRIFWKAETCPIMASGEGKAPELKMVTVTEKIEPIDFVLEPGKTIKVKTVDQNDAPLADVTFSPWRWRGTTRYFEDKLKGKSKSDEQGNWTWNEAPKDSVQFSVYSRGLRSEEPNYVFEPREEPYTVRMIPNTVAKGSVVDAVTKEPLPNFTIHPGYRWSEDYGDPTLQTHSSQGFRDGKFEFEVDRTNFGYNLRFSADGYIPHVTKTFTKDENADLSIELTPAELITGVVLLPDGTPAQNAEVGLFSSATGLETIWGAKLQDSMRRGPCLVTKADGRFTFQPQLEGYVILVFHDAGAAQVYAEDLKSGTVKLQPWSSVEGIVKKGNTPWPGKRIRVATWAECETWDRSHPEIQIIYTATSDEAGKFRIDKVMPGRKTTAFWEEELARSPLDSFLSLIRSDTVNFESEPGKTANVMLGGVGRPVTGKLIVTTEQYKGKINWDFVELELKGIPEKMPAPDYDSLPVPENVDRNDSSAFYKWYWTWVEKDEQGKQFRENERKYDAARPLTQSGRVEKDGTFRVENVPPGRYEVYVRVFQPKPIEEVPFTQGSGIGNDIESRLRLNNTRREPIVVVPKFDGTVTDVPAEIGNVQIDLRK